MQTRSDSCRSFVFSGTLKKQAGGFFGALWQTRSFGLERAQSHSAHGGGNAGSSDDSVCKLFYSASVNAESLQADTNVGCILLSKSSCVSPSEADRTKFILDHVLYTHKISERNSIALLATSWALRDKWVEVISAEISALRVSGAHADAPDAPPSSDSMHAAVSPLQAFAKKPCNLMCADCGAVEPRWASVTHQVLICVECAGVHRNLGRHISFVQGLYNDTWSDEALAAFTSSRGNQLANSQLLEYHVPPSVLKPNPQSSRETRELYITAKYKDKAFHPATDLAPLPPVTMPLSTASRKLSVGEIRYVGVLWVTVLSCHNLVNADVFSKSDPYVTVSVGSNNRLQTSAVIQDDLNPIFNWKAGPFTWNGFDPINIRVFDKDDVTDDSLGLVDVPVVESDFASSGSISRELDLIGVEHGSIKLSITYDKLN